MYSQTHNRYFKRPEGYVKPRRSPTPPNAHVEPLSPKLRALEPSFNYPATNNHAFGYGVLQQPRQEDVHRPTLARARARSDYHKGHGRKPSNIDTLADAALAMSPGLVAHSPGYARSTGHSHAHQAHPPNSEPPHKRARSAYFPSPQAGHYGSRPATSYEGNVRPTGASSQAIYESRVEEAALLLNFRTGGWPPPSPKKLPGAYPQPHVRPHANSVPSNAYYQRPIEQFSRASYPTQPTHAPLLPPFIPQLQPSQLPVANLPSPQRTSEGAGLSPRTLSDRRESDDVNVSRKASVSNPLNGFAQASEPHQTHTPPEEKASNSPFPENAMSETLDAPKKRGWPKGRPRAGVKKSSEKATSKRANKANSKTAKTMDVFAEAALENQKDVRRRHSSSQTPAPEMLERSSPGPRAQSVPRGVKMIVREITPSRASRKQTKAIPDETVCASCNSTRETAKQGGELDQWISCNGCKNWFHVDCAGFKRVIEVRDVDKYFCVACEPSHGKTTYVRKSARAHTSVDYAELQRGVLKTSEDSHEHHYIQPIKDGTFTFDPETFPRMRPELVTRDFLERSTTFVEPICIPAAWNPRPWDVRKQAESAGAVSGDCGENVTPHSSEDFEMVDAENLEYDTVPDEGQDRLDMVMPEGLTVRQVANMVGPDYPLDVIDVKTQNSGAKMNLGKWADYYEEETDDKPIRNVISLEVSQTKLGRLLRRPKVVRDIDLQDEVWPQDEKDKGKFPRVQFYCLMSVADSYTDFHIDFGGSSVYYHILKGKKTFFFIPPKAKHLKAYEEWNDSPQQNFTFLPHITNECYRVDLHAGDTMLIPSGWIHAVWTPETSLVIGGNFLTRMSFKNQFKIVDIEKNNATPQKFRYPHFQRIMWYTAIKYLSDDPLPHAVSQDFYEGKKFYRDRPIWADFDGKISRTDPRQGAQNARYYSEAEIEGLPEVVEFIFRTVMLVQGRIEGVSADRIKRVNASIPKGYGEPLEVAKTFALWVAWKRGNEDPPAWAHPDAILPTSKEEGEPKKLSARALKDMQRKEAMAAWKIAPDRASKRVKERDAKRDVHEDAAASTAASAGAALPAGSASISGNADIYATTSRKGATPKKSSSPSGTAAHHHQFHQSPGQTSPQSSAPSSAMMMSAFPGQFLSTPKTSVLGPKRVACDACRKRRIRCKHKDLVTQAPTPPPFSQQFAPGGATDGYFIPQSTEVGDNITVSPLQRREAQTQNSHHGYCEQQTNGDVQSQAPIQATHNGHGPAEGAFDSPMPGTNAYVNANIPMAMNGVPMFGDGAKRGRSKACFECRKSKRRCIHDESGNVDPVKAAETPIPRGSVSSKKRNADDGSPLDANKRLKPAEPGLSPAPVSMQGMHGILKPNGQPKPSKSATPPKAPPEVYHKLPGQFYRPSSSEGHHEQNLEQNQPQHQHQQVSQQHNAQPNGSAPPIDPSLFTMYPEPSSNNGGPYSAPTNPYHMPDHSSAERPPLYALPSLEQIATEVLDMNGGGDENGEAGLAAIQAFNRQRDDYIQAYQQQNGGLLPTNVPPPVDGSVDSGVSLSGVTEQKDGSSPPGGAFNVFSASNGVDSTSTDAQPDTAPSPMVHHELPPVSAAVSEPESQPQKLEPAPFEAQPEVHDTVESQSFVDFTTGDNDNRRSSLAGIPFYQPPTSMSQSPEMMRSMPNGFPPSSPNKPKRESFVATSPEMFRRPSREFSQPLEETEEVKLGKLLQQDA